MPVPFQELEEVKAKAKELEQVPNGLTVSAGLVEKKAAEKWHLKNFWAIWKRLFAILGKMWHQGL